VKPLSFYLVRTGLLLLFVSIASYLLAIWESGITAERFGLTGVAFMGAGFIALVVGGIMTLWRDSDPVRALRSLQPQDDEDR
jgi:hypothetical protein